MAPIDPIAGSGISGINQLSEFQMRSALEAGQGGLRDAVQSLDERGQAELVASQLEKTFLDMMLSAMRESVQDSGLFGESSATEMFTQMLDQEYTHQAGEQWQFGFHETLVREILRENPAGPVRLGRASGPGTPKEPEGKSPEAETRPVTQSISDVKKNNPEGRT